MKVKAICITNYFFKKIPLLIVGLIKLLKIFLRKIYICYIFSVRNRWYISKNKNYYNPSLKATVYQWSTGWNIARFNKHYEGYKTKKLAQEAAFKMWLKERIKNKGNYQTKGKFIATFSEEKTIKKLINVTGEVKDHTKLENIVFSLKNEWLVTQLGDIELKVRYTATEWSLEWFQYEIVTECQAEWWCYVRDCDFDALDLKTVDVVDELCPQCPRVKIRRIIQTAYTSDKFTHPPTNFEFENVRQNILNQYKTLSHNGLYNNKFLYKIMHSKWIHI